MPNRAKYELTPEIEAAILGSLEEGNFRKHAAAQAGIPDYTLKSWLRLGEQGDERYAVLYDRVMAAEHAAIASSLRKVTGARDWKAAAWYLARKSPEEYGNPEKSKVRKDLETLLEILEEVCGKETARRVLEKFTARASSQAA